jgi:uncharacterized membrane protein
MTDAPDDPRGSVPAPLRATVAALEGDARLDRLARPVDLAADRVSTGPAASVLRGEWLGHALHPLLTDVPLGCWLSAGLLDLVGGPGSRRSAQRLIGIGLLAVPPTVASGLSDYSLLDDAKRRRVGAVHAVGNTLVAYLYFRSWRARRRGHHLRGVALGMLGGTGAWATGYLGGHLSYARGAGSGERGLNLDAAAATNGEVAPGEQLVDLTRASELIGVPEPQVLAMTEEGLLDPVEREPVMRFRDADVRALRLLGS